MTTPSPIYRIEEGAPNGTPKRPCWIYHPTADNKVKWWQVSGGLPIDWLSSGFTHWSPDSATPPSSPPERQPEEGAKLPPLRTADEWLKIHPVKIVDPDGWRGDGRSWNDKITEQEFHERVAQCTIAHITPPPAPPTERETETPRTDAVWNACEHKDWKDMFADMHEHAEKLELECASLRSSLARAEGEREAIDRVAQTRKGYGGNCLAACLASILRIPIESIPELAGPDIISGSVKQSTQMRAYLRSLGLDYIEIDMAQGFSWTENAIPDSAPALFAVKSTTPEVAAKGFGHFVVGRVRQEEDQVVYSVVHDPAGNFQDHYEISAVGFVIARQNLAALRASLQTANQQLAAANERIRILTSE